MSGDRARSRSVAQFEKAGFIRAGDPDGISAKRPCATRPPHDCGAKPNRTAGVDLTRDRSADALEGEPQEFATKFT